jgi:hypothetical protein
MRMRSLTLRRAFTRTPVVDPRSFIDGIGFLHNWSDCCHDVWTTLSQFYFDFLKHSGRYRGLEVLRMGQQPQPFSYLQVYLGSIDLDTKWATSFLCQTFQFASQYGFASTFLFVWHLSNLSLLQLLSEEYKALPPCLVHLPEVLVILLHRTRNNNGKVEKDCHSVEFPFVSNSLSWDIMRFRLLSC